MANNNNFVVQNGLTVGPLVIDAITGSITTTGNISTTGTVTTFINEVTLGNEAIYGNLSVNSAIQSTSTTSGSFQVAGGVGITQDLFVGGNIKSLSTSYVQIAAGTSAQRPVTPNIGMIRYNSDISSFEGFGAGSAWSSLGGVKSVDGKAYISAEASAGAGDDVLRFYSGSTGTSQQVMWASGANVTIPLTTAASGVGTGALIIGGGLSVGQEIYVADDVYSGGNYYNSIITIDAAGTVAANATPATAQINVINNVSYDANGNPGGIILPTPEFAGLVVYVDAGDNAVAGVNLYPDSTGVIDSADPGAPVLLANHAYWIGVCESINPTVWASFVGQFTGNTNQITVAYGNGGAFIALTDPLITPGDTTISGNLTVSGGEMVTGNLSASGAIAGSQTIAGFGVYDGGLRVLSTSSGAGNLYISSSSVSLPTTGPGATTFGSTSHIPVINTDAYGRVTSGGNVSIAAPANALTGTTLASGVVASSLTSVGTLTSLSVAGSITVGTEIITNTLNVPTVLAQTINSPTIGNLGAIMTGVLSPQANVQANINVVGTLNSLSVKGNTAVTSTIWGQGLYDNGQRVISTTPSADGNVTLYGTSVSLTPMGPGAVTTGSASQMAIITTDVYGRIVGVSQTPPTAPAGLLTGSTLASGVTASSLTSVGTLTGLTVSGTTNAAGGLVASTVHAGTIGNSGATITGTTAAFGTVSMTGDLTIAGNLYVSNVINQSSSTVSSASPLLQLVSTPYPYNFDIGIYSDFKGGAANVTAYTGVARNHTTSTWTFFSNIFNAPAGGLINFTDGNLVYDNITFGKGSVQSTAATTSTTSGAFTVAGGVGIVGDLFVGGNIVAPNSSNSIIYQSTASYNAAGTVQANATPITTQIAVVNNVTYGTGGTTPGGIRLPKPTYAGQIVYVDAGNNSTHGVYVYPDSGGAIDELAANAGILIPLNEYWIGIAESINPTSWASFQTPFVGNTNQVNVTFGSGIAWVGLANPTITPGDVTISGNLTSTGFVYQSITNLDAAGSTQSTAATFNTAIAVVGNVAVGSGIRLPAPQYPGQVVYVDAGPNANPLNLYPDVGGQIDEAPTNGAVQLNTSAYWIGVCESVNPSSWASFVGAQYGNVGQLAVSYGNGGSYFGLANPMITPGAVTINGVATSQGNIIANAKTNSTSTTTGALVVPNGGVGIAGNLFVGQNLVSSGMIYQGFSTPNAAGTTQGTATQITTAVTAVNTVPTTSGIPGGLILPKPQFPGQVVYVDVGSSAPNGMYLYPDVGGAIDNAATNAGILLENGAYWIGVAETINPTSWASFVGQYISPLGTLNIQISNGGTNFDLASPLTTPGAATISGALTVNGSTTVNGMLYQTSGNVVSAGTTQSGATAITNQITKVTSGASGAGIILPTPSYAGQVIYVDVTTGAPYGVNLYPNSGGFIDQAGLNTPVLLTSGSRWVGVCSSISPAQWTTQVGSFIGNTSQVTTTYGSGQTYIGLANPVVTPGGATINGTMNIAGSILPTANVTYNLGSSTAWFNQFYGVSTQAKYADLAENYQADKAYNPGTVMMFGGTQEVTVADANTTAVAGVVSTNPAHLMNGQLSGASVVPLALTGRVPCQVIGPVKKGDLMVSAGFGYAKTNNSPAVGSVIGKALEDFAIAGKGVIEVVVGRF